MNFNQLRYFITLAETLNFRRTAAMLGIRQAPLSDSIRRLEDHMGARLLERNRHSVELTDAGEVLLTEARALMQQVSFVSNVVRLSQGADRAGLKIGYVGHGLSAAGAVIMEEATCRYPQIPLVLKELVTSPFNALLSGEVDVALIVFPVSARHPDIEFRFSGQSDLVAALPKGSPLAAYKTVTMRQLAASPLILFPRLGAPEFHAQIIAACARSVGEANIVYETSMAFTRLKLVAAGIGVSVANRDAMVTGFAGVEFRPISDLPNSIRIDFAIAWHSCTSPEYIEIFEAAAARLR